MKRLFIVLLLIFSIPFFFTESYASQNSQSKIFVLVYHTFLGKKNLATDVSLADFQFQIDTLKNKGYNFVRFEDVKAGKISGSKNILVSIDDGERSLLKAYNEVLKPKGIKPLLAIYPNIIGKKHNALTWEEVRTLSNDGCSIAAHGYYHLFVNQKLYDKDRRSFMGEIYRSKKVLEENIGKSVTVFVYPFGVRSAITKKTLREAGYLYAFNLNWRYVEVPLNRNGNLLELGRYMLSGNNAKAIFGAINSSSRNHRKLARR